MGSEKPPLSSKFTNRSKTPGTKPKLSRSHARLSARGTPSLATFDLVAGVWFITVSPLGRAFALRLRRRLDARHVMARARARRRREKRQRERAEARRVRAEFSRCAAVPFFTDFRGGEGRRARRDDSPGLSVAPFGFFGGSR